MTPAGLAAPRLEDGSPRPQDPARVVACAFCRRRLSNEYFFSCRRCDASYCYIHMSRHEPAACARQTGRRRRAQGQSEGVHVRAGGQLLLAGSAPGRPLSANV